MLLNRRPESGHKANDRKQSLLFFPTLSPSRFAFCHSDRVSPCQAKHVIPFNRCLVASHGGSLLCGLKRQGGGGEDRDTWVDFIDDPWKVSVLGFAFYGPLDEAFLSQRVDSLPIGSRGLPIEEFGVASRKANAGRAFASRQKRIFGTKLIEAA